MQFKKFLYAFSLLLLLNLQGMENNSEITQEPSENTTVQENEPEESSLKMFVKGLIMYGPTIYTYTKPIAHFIGVFPSSSTLISFIKNSEFKSKKRDFSPEFLHRANTIMNNIGIKTSSLTFCPINDYIPKLSTLHQYSPALMDKNGMFVYAKNFLNYSFDIQTFIFAHECIHLKEKHNLLLNCAGIAMPFITHYGIKYYQLMADRIINHCTKKYNVQNNKTVQNCIYVHNMIVNSGLFYAFVTGLAHHKLTQYAEMRADIGAAKVLNSAKGGIKLFAMELEEVNSMTQNLGTQNLGWARSLLAKCLIFCVQTISSHPSHQTRIAYLTKLQKQFEK